MRLSDFDYDLPEKFIAHSPASKRDESKLMVIRKDTKEISHHVFSDLPNLLPANTLMIRNNAKVLKARLRGTFDTGGSWELFFLEPRSKKSGLFLVNPGRKFKEGTTVDLYIEDQLFTIQVRKVLPTGEREIVFLNLEHSLEELLKKFGNIPLPPYIKTEDASKYEDRYQTVFAKNEGSVAAPTAGLHFTDEIFKQLNDKGIEIDELTLHVGLGTFQPVKTENVLEHDMHSERFAITKSTITHILEAKEKNWNIATVGTTSTRVLEHLWHTYSKEELQKLPDPFESSTDIFIYPPYTFKAIDILITNFHLPKSTLLMLVSALVGDREFLLHAYEEAKKNEYRFYSFGDAMLIL